jgi:hypothetical protein
MALTTAAARKAFEEQADWLRKVRDSEGKSTRIRHQLHVGNSGQLRALILAIHFGTGGEIPLAGAHIERLKTSKKGAYINKEFLREKEIRALLASDRKTKLEKLYKITSVIPLFVAPLFSSSTS